MGDCFKVSRMWGRCHIQVCVIIQVPPNPHGPPWVLETHGGVQEWYARLPTCPLPNRPQLKPPRPPGHQVKTRSTCKVKLTVKVQTTPM
jgi:hypothetical protein